MMARFCGKVGYAEIVETGPGVFEEQIIERIYFGDWNKISRNLQPSGQINDNLTISNEVSIVSDPYANQNFLYIRYVESMGIKWKVTNVSVQYPRLVLTLGGVYNG